MAGPAGETSESGSAPFTVVYAFAGPSRYCDIRSCLEQLIPGISVLEFDICRDDKHDLTRDSVWEQIFGLVAKPRTAYITSPPCNTHSRARHRKPGPQPLRSSVWPRGFPWLTPAKAAAVEDANFMIDSSVKASTLAAEAGNSFLWEHPENLGVAADGVIPASIWDLPELLDLLSKFHAISFALFQCQYGAPSSKPTRFLTNLDSLVRQPPPYAKLPCLDASGRYLGPLPKACPHGSHESLIGRDPATGKWRTAPSASYPPDLCKLLARAVADSLTKGGPSNSSSSATARSSSSAVAAEGVSSAMPERLASAQPDATPQGLQGLQPEGLSGAECLEPSCLMPQFSQPEGSELEPGHGSIRDHPLSLKPLGSGYRPQKPLEQGQEQAPRTPTVGPLGFRPDSPQSVPLGFRPESRGPGKKTGQPCTGRSPALDTKVDSSSGQHSFPPVPPKGLGFSPEPLGLQSQKDAPATLAPFPGEEAEAFAARLLKKGEELRRSELEALQGLLPLEAAPREEEGGRASSFVVGAYCKGGLVGLRKHTASFPTVCKVLTSYLEQIKPGFTFSAVALFQGVKTPVHKDSRNAPFPNLVAPIGQFTGGSIWIEDPKGCVPENTPAGRRLGVDLSVDKGPVIFNAYDSFHFTRAWKGNRLVLVAYTTDRLSMLDQQDSHRLRELGFRPPVEGSETSEAHQAARTSQQPVHPFRPELCGNRGLPLEVEWEGHTEPITDGFGLCSPTRWRPEDRGGSLSKGTRALCRALHQLGLDFLREQVPDPRTLCQSLEKGELESSPFEESAMHRLRQRWCMLVGGKDWRHLASIPSGQPFLLRALAKTAELMGDADWEILTEGVDNYCSGVPLGFREEVPHLYDHKTKWRKLDEDLPEWDRPNYSSASVNAKQLLEKFREEERLGRMASTTLGALKQDYPEDRIRVASMGAIRKPDGTVRPVHDGTHGVHVNQEIKQLNLLSVPGPAEVAWLVRQAHEQRDAPFALTGDVAAAHRLVLIRKSDWALLACRAENDSPTIFVNRVGTFGISSASLWGSLE